MQSWTFPIVPRATNEIRGAHWRQKHAERKRWGKAVLLIPPGPWQAGVPYAPNHPWRGVRVRLRITVYRWNRQDPDNAVASVKPLLDALKARGWLVDDSPKWLEFEVAEEIDRKEQRTEIEWEALGD